MKCPKCGTRAAMGSHGNLVCPRCAVRLEAKPQSNGAPKVRVCGTMNPSDVVDGMTVYTEGVVRFSTIVGLVIGFLIGLLIHLEIIP